MVRKIIVFISLTILIVLLFGYLYNSKVKKMPKIEIAKRLISDNNLTQSAKYTFNSTPHRLFRYKDSLLVLTDTFIYVLNKDLTYKRELISQFDSKSGIFYYMPTTKGIAEFNFLEYSLLFKTSDEIKIKKSRFPILNAIWFNEKFYYYTLDKNESLKIESWNPINDENKTKCVITDILKDSLKSKDCKLETLEGNFFSIGKENLGFYFYRSGIFLLINKDTSKIINSIIRHPFIEFYKKNVKAENGEELSICEPTKDIFVQMCASSDGKHIYMLSSYGVDKSSVIDVYDKNGSYIKSIKLPAFGNKEMPTEILVMDNTLYVVFNNNLLSYQLKLT